MALLSSVILSFGQEDQKRLPFYLPIAEMKQEGSLGRKDKNFQARQIGRYQEIQPITITGSPRLAILVCCNKISNMVTK